MSPQTDTKSPRPVPSGLFPVHGSRMVILDPGLTHGSSISFLIDFLNQRPVRRDRSNEPVNELPVSFPELVLGNIQGRPYDCKRILGVRRIVRFVSRRFIDFLIQFILEVSLLFEFGVISGFRISSGAINGRCLIRVSSRAAILSVGSSTRRQNSGRTTSWSCSQKGQVLRL